MSERQQPHHSYLRSGPVRAFAAGQPEPGGFVIASPLCYQESGVCRQLSDVSGDFKPRGVPACPENFRTALPSFRRC